MRHKPLPEPWKTIVFVAGMASTLIGLIGITVPVLPTAPFMILAALCFSRSSEAFHRRLRASKWFGKAVRQWEDHGVISLHGKLGATFFILASLIYSLWFKTPKWVPLAIIIFGGAGLAFVWTRPTKPRS